MKNQTLTLGLLATMALALTAALWMLPGGQRHADAGTVVKDRDYQIVTAKASGAGDVLFIQRGDLVAVFAYDNSTRSLQPRDVRRVAELFGRR